MLPATACPGIAADRLPFFPLSADAFLALRGGGPAGFTTGLAGGDMLEGFSADFRTGEGRGEREAPIGVNVGLALPSSFASWASAAFAMRAKTSSAAVS